MNNDSKYNDLETLEEWELEHGSQDIRGLPLVDDQGQKLGIIEDLLVDREHERVEAVRLGDGRITDIAPLVLHDNCVVLKGELASADTGSGNASAARGKTDVENEEVIPVVEERISIGKRVAQNGDSIRVRTRVVKDKINEDVRLREETVDVNRQATDQKLSAAEADAAFQDRDLSVTAHSEELVVSKDAVVTEELVVSKDVGERVEQVEETVRKTEVEVDRDSTKGKR